LLIYPTVKIIKT